jgi:hypothetical protein
MAVGVTSQLFQGVTATNRFCQTNKFRNPDIRSSLTSTSLSSVPNGHNCWGHNILERNYRPMLYVPSRYRALGVRSFALPVSLQEIPLVKSTSVALTR